MSLWPTDKLVSPQDPFIFLFAPATPSSRFCSSWCKFRWSRRFWTQRFHRHIRLPPNRGETQPSSFLFANQPECWEHVSRTKHVLYGLKALWLPCQLIFPPFFPELETGTLHVTGWPPAGRQGGWKMLRSWWQCFNCGLICRLFWINKCGTTSYESQMQSPTPPHPTPPRTPTHPADTRQDVMSKNSRVNCST